MKVRGGEFSTGTMGNFQPELTNMLNALFALAYGLETPFFPQLAAPNLAPKTELYL